MLSDDKKLIHVKHRKGGSSGLSHLFAQGSTSAEAILGDHEFRQSAREKLKEVGADEDLIPLSKPKGVDYEVVYLLLGEDPSSVVDNLPFFSKINLSRTLDNLQQKGFAVSIGGAPKLVKDDGSDESDEP